MRESGGAPVQNGYEKSRIIECLRRKEQIPRSLLIQRAVALYLSERGRYQAIRAYEDGYRRHPEGANAEAYAEAAAEVLAVEDWNSTLRR